jgi:predicted Zn-ribbon and HTH transcriptional regulator
MGLRLVGVIVQALITFPRGKKRCGYEFEDVELRIEGMAPNVRSRARPWDL